MLLDMTEPLPPQPREPLAYATPHSAIETESRKLAVRGLRALGVLCILVGTGCGALDAAEVLAPPKRGTVSLTWDDFTGLAVLQVIGVIGIVYVICAAKIRRGSRSAGIVALVIASVQEGLIILLLGTTIVTSTYHGDFRVISVGAEVLVALGFAQLIRDISRFLRSFQTN
jgi:hypothetical protein